MDIATALRGHTVLVRTAALRVTISLAAGTVLIVTFLRLMSLSTVYHHLRHLDLGVALPCGVTFLSSYVGRAMRWRCLLTPNVVSVSRAAAIYYVAIFLNWLLPIRGGEVAMSLLLRRSDGIPVNKSLAAASMDIALFRRPRILFTAAIYTIIALGLDALFCLLAFRAVGVMTCTGLACLSAMGLALRGTFRLARETETEEKEDTGHGVNGELTTSSPWPTRAGAVASDDSIGRRYSQ